MLLYGIRNVSEKATLLGYDEIDIGDATIGSEIYINNIDIELIYNHSTIRKKSHWTAKFHRNRVAVQVVRICG